MQTPYWMEGAKEKRGTSMRKHHFYSHTEYTKRRRQIEYLINSHENKQRKCLNMLSHKFK